MIYKTISSKQTKKLAGLMAIEILKKRAKNKNILVLALSGDLGVGKTTFIKGFLRKLGVKKKITSPTFVITKNYKLKAKNHKIIYHIDCYRIKKPKELSVLGFKEILTKPQSIVLIEWPERIRKILPKSAIWLKFKYGKIINERVITII